MATIVKTKQGFELQPGDLICAGRVSRVSVLTVWYGILFHVAIEGSRMPVVFEPTESVAIACCDGASRDCAVHGDGN